MGKEGGEALKKKYGKEYYQRIGRLGGLKGGKVNAANHDTAYFREIGRKGGSTTKERHGLEHFAKMGGMSKRSWYTYQKNWRKNNGV